MTTMSRRRSRQMRERAQREPLRIVVDKRPTNYGPQGAYTSIWVVSPRERDIRGSDVLDFASYSLEIRYNGLHIDAEHPCGEITWIAYRDGTRYEFMPDEAFIQHRNDIASHEGCTDDEASVILTDKNVWPEANGRTFGFRMDYFPRMELAWAALRQFVDLGYTS